MIASFFTFIYLLHWLYFNNSTSHKILSLIIHIELVIMVASLFFFERSEMGTVEKLPLKEVGKNAVGQLLSLMEQR